MNVDKKISIDAYLKQAFKDVYDNDISDVEFSVVYTYELEKALYFKYQLEQELGIKVTNVDHLSLSVSTHIGPGSLAVTSAKIIK